MEDSFIICPSPASDGTTLFSHKITAQRCAKRQGIQYHKCPKCSHSTGARFELIPEPPKLRAAVKPPGQNGRANGRTNGSAPRAVVPEAADARISAGTNGRSNH